MDARVVHPCKHDVLKREASLVGEIVSAQQLYRFGNRHRTLRRHQFRALLVEGRVQADGHVTLAFIEEPAEFLPDAHAAHRDAARTPRPAPVGSENLRGAKHLVEVVHRLALPHEHDVREAFALRQGVDLVQNVGSGEVAVESLFSRLAEKAVHLASHLTRHAERSPLTVRDIDGFDIEPLPLPLFRM